MEFVVPYLCICQKFYEASREKEKYALIVCYQYFSSKLSRFVCKREISFLPFFLNRFRSEMLNNSEKERRIHGSPKAERENFSIGNRWSMKRKKRGRQKEKQDLGLTQNLILCAMEISEEEKLSIFPIIAACQTALSTPRQTGQLLSSLYGQQQQHTCLDA